MSADSQKIVTVLEILSRSLDEEGNILRVKKWIEEISETNEPAVIKSAAKEPRQVLTDTRRQLLGMAKRIEASL
jgi:hypothetical protein